MRNTLLITWKICSIYKNRRKNIFIIVSDQYLPHTYYSTTNAL